MNRRLVLLLVLTVLVATWVHMPPGPIRYLKKVACPFFGGEWEEQWNGCFKVDDDCVYGIF